MGDLFNAGKLATPLPLPSSKTYTHFLCHLLPQTQRRHPLLSADTRHARFNPPELRLYVARKHADTQTSCVVTHFNKKPVCEFRKRRILTPLISSRRH